MLASGPTRTFPIWDEKSIFQDAKSTIALEHKDKILIMCPNIGGTPERLKASRTKLITKSIAKV